MDWTIALALLFVLGLVVYLCVALLFPEKLS